MANIQNELNNIKTALYGKDVRNSIHDAIKTCYDDASVNNDNANMEVKLARGTHNTLNDRLCEVDEKQNSLSSQLEQIEKNKTNINIRAFGAVGDGVSNDTLSIQNAINSIAVEGGNVYIPNGTYKITNTIKLYSNVSIIGESRDSTILKHNGDQFNYVLSCSNIDNVKIENITIEGTKSHNSLPSSEEYGYGVTIANNSKHVKINNCKINDMFYTGISLRDCSYCNITNSLFENNNTNAIAITKSVNNVIIENNSFLNNHYQNINAENSDYTLKVKNIICRKNYIEGAGTSNGWGISFSTGNLEEVGENKYSEIFIESNIIKNIYKAINLKNCESIFISNNTLSDLIIGIHVTKGLEFGENCSINNNYISNSGSGVILNGIDYSQVNGNIINNCSDFGIQAKTNNTIISKNIIASTNRSGLRIEGQNTSILNNRFKNNKTQAIEVSSNENNLYNEIKNNTFTCDNGETSYVIVFKTLSNYIILENNNYINISTFSGSKNIGTNVIVQNNNSW